MCFLQKTSVCTVVQTERQFVQDSQFVQKIQTEYVRSLVLSIKLSMILHNTSVLVCTYEYVEVPLKFKHIKLH